MTIITIRKQNQVKYGSPERIAPFLNMSGQGVRKWIRAYNEETNPEQKEIKSTILKNGWMIYLNTERV